MIAKAFSLQTPSGNKRLFGSSLSVNYQRLSLFHQHTSYPRDLRNEMSFSQNSMPFTSSDPAAEPYLLESMARDKADGGRDDLRQKIDLAFGYLRSQEEE